MSKWNNVITCKDSDKHYYTAKLYCIKVRVNKNFEGGKFRGFRAELVNTKTKMKFETKNDWGITFKTLDEAKLWCEKYGRYTYFTVYKEYKDWIGIETPIFKKKDKGNHIKTEIIWRPVGGEEVWNEYLQVEKDSVEIYRSHFEGLEFNIGSKNIVK